VVEPNPGRLTSRTGTGRVSVRVLLACPISARDRLRIGKLLLRDARWQQAKLLRISLGQYDARSGCPTGTFKSQRNQVSLD
jgi:hypothetical protein